MKILTKKLMPAEVQCRCIVLPRDKTGNFPSPGVEFDITEGKTIHRAKLDRQFRLRALSWFHQHQAVKAGDEITFSKDNGLLRISLTRILSKPDKETFKWMHEVLDAIRDGDVFGIIKVSNSGFIVEIGEQVKETQIILATK